MRIRNLLLQNPDVDHDDCWGEFTIEGQKRCCALVSVYPGTYAEAAEEDPDASFYAYMQSVLVPLDEPDTMIPIADMPGFYDLLVRYDLTLDTRKVLFVPYATPALIRGIHATLLEHFPKKD